MKSFPSHFKTDLEKAGKHIEAVIDWNGTVIYYSKTGIKNVPDAAGRLEPLVGYAAGFIDERGVVIGFAKIDMFESATETIVKVIGK
jgi:hypothetical protein